MAERPGSSDWQGERAALLAEIEENRRLYESNALDDDGDWNFWVENHPRFATYWNWQRSLDPQERYDAAMSGDRHLLNWYFDGKRPGPNPPAAPPLATPPVLTTSAEPALHELRGVVKRFMYVDPKTGYMVTRVAPERPDDVAWAVSGAERLITVVGTVPGDKAGDRIVVSGRWQNDPKHGWQFQSVGGRIDITPATRSLWAVVREHPTAKRIGGVLLVCGIVLFGLAQCAQDLGLVDGSCAATRRGTMSRSVAIWIRRASTKTIMARRSATRVPPSSMPSMPASPRLGTITA